MRRARGSGAPSGERNGNYRHGLYTAEAIAERKAIRAWLRWLRTWMSLLGINKRTAHVGIRSSICFF